MSETVALLRLLVVVILSLVTPVVVAAVVRTHRTNKSAAIDNAGGAGSAVGATGREGNSTNNNVLVVYYSFTADGCTARMATEVAAGAKSANASVKLQRVNETSCDDVSWADAVIVGSPVHFANPASDVVAFFEDLQNVCFGWPLTALEKKVGGAFVDGGGQDKGKDTTLQSIHGALLSMRFVVRGCVEGTCNAWGATATNLDHPGHPGSLLTDDEVAGCRDLGTKIAELSAIVWH